MLALTLVIVAAQVIEVHAGGALAEITVVPSTQTTYTRADVVNACCTIDPSHSCTVHGRLTCTQLFALPDYQLPSECVHRMRGTDGEHIICLPAGVLGGIQFN